MHLFFTLIASGLLMFTEVPAEQPPPTVQYYAPTYLVGYTVGYPTSTPTVTPNSATQVSASEVPIDPLIRYDGRYTASTPVESLTVSSSSLPTQANLEVDEASQPPSVEGEMLKAGPEALPTQIKASPTPQAKSTNTDGVTTNNRQHSQLPITGYAMYYNPNVMQEVLNNRIAMGHISPCNECIGNVALLRAGDLNRRVWLQWADGVVEGPFLVADVAAAQHISQLLARNWVVDVDNRTAVRRGMAGPVLVTVWGAPPTISQQEVPPFAPLYPATALPTLAPTPGVASVPLAVGTPAPTLTALPALIGTPIANMTSGFPTETSVPTITPLPALNSAPTPTLAAPTASPPQNVVPTATLLPTNTPLPTITPLPTATALPTNTPIPTATLLPLPTVENVVIGGFPTESPVPTITPLPMLNATPTATVAIQVEGATATPIPTLAPLPTPTALPTFTVTLIPSATPTPVATATIVPTNTPTPLPTATNLPTQTPTLQATATSLPTNTPTATFTATPTITLTPTVLPTAPPSASPTATTVITQGGFPTDTPVPTITALPLISPVPSPTNSAP